MTTVLRQGVCRLYIKDWPLRFRSAGMQQTKIYALTHCLASETKESTRPNRIWSVLIDWVHPSASLTTSLCRGAKLFALASLRRFRLIFKNVFQCSWPVRSYLGVALDAAGSCQHELITALRSRVTLLIDDNNPTMLIQRYVTLVHIFYHRYDGVWPIVVCYLFRTIKQPLIFLRLLRKDWPFRKLSTVS